MGAGQRVRPGPAALDVGGRRDGRLQPGQRGAATLAACTAVAGAAGQLLIGRFIDRRGAGTTAWMPLIAVPCLLVIGFVQLGTVGYIVVLLLAYLFIVGGHGGIIGIFYRPAIRASGAGWATSMSKFGAMLGPWLAGVVLDAGVDARGTFFVFAFFPVVMLVALVILGRIQRSLPAAEEGSLQPLPGRETVRAG